MIANYVELARQEIVKEAARIVEQKDKTNLQLIHANERKAHYKAKYHSQILSQTSKCMPTGPPLQATSMTNTHRARKSTYNKKSSKARRGNSALATTTTATTLSH